jgi:hypothetical protein
MAELCSPAGVSTRPGHLGDADRFLRDWWTPNWPSHALVPIELGSADLIGDTGATQLAALDRLPDGPLAHAQFGGDFRYQHSTLSRCAVSINGHVVVRIIHWTIADRSGIIVQWTIPRRGYHRNGGSASLCRLLSYDKSEGLILNDYCEVCAMKHDRCSCGALLVADLELHVGLLVHLDRDCPAEKAAA